MVSEIRSQKNYKHLTVVDLNTWPQTGLQEKNIHKNFQFWKISPRKFLFRIISKYFIQNCNFFFGKEGLVLENNEKTFFKFPSIILHVSATEKCSGFCKVKSIFSIIFHTGKKNEFSAIWFTFSAFVFDRQWQLQVATCSGLEVVNFSSTLCSF